MNSIAVMPVHKMIELGLCGAISALRRKRADVQFEKHGLFPRTFQPSPINVIVIGYLVRSLRVLRPEMRRRVRNCQFAVNLETVARAGTGAWHICFELFAAFRHRDGRIQTHTDLARRWRP